MVSDVPVSLALELRQASHRMQRLLDRFSQYAPPLAQHLSVISFEQISTLISELQQSERVLRLRLGCSDTVLDQEIAEYRNQVERLRDLLPVLSEMLRGEQVRLKQQSERMRAASDWIRSSNQTVQTQFHE